MATLAMPQSIINPSSPVTLDTIPISPTRQTNGSSGKENEVSRDGDEVVTVFHDPNNFNVKHPLANTWTLWFTKPPTGKVISYSHGLDVLQKIS